MRSKRFSSSVCGFEPPDTALPRVSSVGRCSRRAVELVCCPVVDGFVVVLSLNEGEDRCVGCEGCGNTADVGREGSCTRSLTTGGDASLSIESATEFWHFEWICSSCSKGASSSTCPNKKRAADGGLSAWSCNKVVDGDCARSSLPSTVRIPESSRPGCRSRFFAAATFDSCAAVSSLKGDHLVSPSVEFFQKANDGI